MASKEMSEAEFVCFLNNTLRLIACEQSTYIPTDSVGYRTVAYLPNLGHNSSVLLLGARAQWP